MFDEARQSVAVQTLPAAHHLVLIDHGMGPARARNQILNVCRTEWVAFLDDDDLLDPDHLEVLSGGTADVRIPYCRLEGDTIPKKFYNQPYDRAKLRDHGIFPITVLARYQAVMDAGGFRPEDRWEDWSLWNRMADNGATFEVTPQVTWTYRLGHDNRTWAQ